MQSELFELPRVTDEWSPWEWSNLETGSKWQWIGGCGGYAYHPVHEETGRYKRQCPMDDWIEAYKQGQ